VDSGVWTERLLVALATGLNYFAAVGLFSLKEAHQAARQSS
jgi:hypothetical protein